MIRNRRPLVALIMVGLVALTGAGCGSSAERSGAGGTSNAPSSTSSGGASTVHTQASKREKAERFAECVRAHGVPHFPDPDAAGSFNFGVDVSAAVFTAAVNACKALQPPGSLSSMRSHAQQSAVLRFAACVRRNGVPDFPDPVNGQPVINTYLIPSANRPGGMTILNAATHKCGSVLGPDAGSQGGGSGG